MAENDEFLVAERDYEAEETIIELGSVSTSKDDSRRIQLNDNKFILPPKMIYHSCEPNAYIDWSNMSLKALKDIKIGDLVTYHYGTSEYDYSVGAFYCDCGSKDCVIRFSGYKDLTLYQQKKIAKYTSDYIRGK